MTHLFGLFVQFPLHALYDWAFSDPVRKIFYNLAITGLSIAVALFIGSIELIKVLHDDTGFGGPVAEWIAGIDLNNAGFAIVGLFVLAWIVAVAYWRLAKVDERWAPTPTEESA